MTSVTPGSSPAAGRPEYEPAFDAVPSVPGEASELALRDGADLDALGQLIGAGEDMMLLYALQIAMRDDQIASGKEDVQMNHERFQSCMEQIREAVRKAEEAAKQGGFFGELFDKFGVLAKVAVVVAAAASVVMTGGASLAVIGALAGTLLSTFSSELAEFFGGSETLEKMFLYGGMALSVGAMGVGLFTSAGAAAAGGATAVQKVAAGVGQVANWAQPVATVGQAGTGYLRDQAYAEALDARADEKELRTERTHALRETYQSVEFVNVVQKSFHRALAALKTALDEQADGQLALANFGVRA